MSSSIDDQAKKFTYDPQAKWDKFDIEDICNKLVTFGEMISGIKMHEYQIEFQKRLFESVLKHDGEEITSLWSRQCLPKGTLILERDGTVMPIEKNPRSWCTGEQKVFRVTLVNGRTVS